MPAKVVHIDEIERVRGPGTLTWLPVRATLDVRAFGCNAYMAGAVGDDVVEPHTEEVAGAAGHQELYYVARGRAEFTVDGERFEARAGTYVFLPDPASHRHATALEEETTVLSFGGPPHFEPSAWEWYFRARPLYRSDPQRAREILEDGLRAHPDDPTIREELARLENRGAAGTD